MRTPAELEIFKEEIRAVCKRHGLVIVGTCENESIYGEIGIFDAADESKWWHEMRPVLFNFQDNT